MCEAYITVTDSSRTTVAFDMATSTVKVNDGPDSWYFTVFGEPISDHSHLPPWDASEDDPGPYGWHGVKLEVVTDD